MAISKVRGGDAKLGPDGDALLASGAHMAMRLWRNEKPQEKTPHRSAYETLATSSPEKRS